MKKNRRRLLLVGLSILLHSSGVLGVFFPSTKSEAASIKKEVPYDSASGEKTSTKTSLGLRNLNILFSIGIKTNGRDPTSNSLLGRGK
ncbi:hypothetical protein gpAD87_26970 [Paenibacillus sp. AD87]|nr:hypothetical protein gpAD87_26970 [Paenibacillus sp. AD87]